MRTLARALSLFTGVLLLAFAVVLCLSIVGILPGLGLGVGAMWLISYGWYGNASFKRYGRRA